ncbi:MAG: nucleotide sugar dehydrogenase [Firmicutes bacterium]|nr:nucleotide sugar dehydrogenase [Bacillota bacterium]
MINVIGLGYIGLPTALMLAASGNDVLGTDINEAVIAALRRRELPFFETGLTELFAKARHKGIRFSLDLENAGIYIIAVPTPYDSQSKKVDMSFVIAAFEGIQNICPENAIVVIESTVSPGSIDRAIRPLLSKNIRLAHAPERIIPGNMLFELCNNARIIGADDSDTEYTLKELYSSFCTGEIIPTDIKTAEMTKVVENTYRDINIAFANELAKICHYGGMDVYEIIRMANKHPRVNILQPGPGVGGHCIAVDPWFLVGDYPGLANIVLAARKINDSMPEFVLERIREIMKLENIKDPRQVGLYGLTYKDNIDDTRQSPTLQLLACMREHLAPALKCYDPKIKERIVENQCFSLKDFLSGLDMIVIMTAHDEIIEQYRHLHDKIVLDTHNALPKGNNVYALTRSLTASCQK